MACGRTSGGGPLLQWLANMMQPYRSLASANAGETLAIRRFRSRQVAELCEQLGMREGEFVQCRVNTRACLILRTSAGRVISLDPDWARHVQIEEAAAPLPA
jgi:hypothetical protein